MARNVTAYLATDSRHQHPLTKEQVRALPPNTQIVYVTPRGRDVETTVGKLIENDKAARIASRPRGNG